MKNKRKHTRLPFEMSATVIFASGFSCTGLTKNISFSGMYVECAELPMVRPGEPCSAVLTLAGTDSFPLKFHCEVVHGYGTMVALKFTSQENDEYFERFLNLIIVSSPDPEAFRDELRKNPVFPD